MKRSLFLLALLGGSASAALPPSALERAVARPAPDARLPGGLVFADQGGRMHRLGEIAGERPLLLLFADYTCRHVCAPGAMLTGAALRATGLAPGRDYAFAIVGLDPRDGQAQARAFAARTGAPAAYLVGTPATVAAATRALGYGTVYDAESDQFAHDATAYVFRADGALAATLPEIGLRADTLRAALAGAAPPPGFATRVARLCYGLAAAHGRFGRPVAIGLQVLAAATLAGLAIVATRMRRA